MLPLFVPFADYVLLPLAPVVAWIVVSMQLTITSGLFTNRYVKPALWAGIALNLCFTIARRCANRLATGCGLVDSCSARRSVCTHAAPSGGRR